MGAGGVNLTYYHKLFLGHLICHEVDFLIIGGQARVYYDGGTTEDLDLWLPVINGVKSRVHLAIVDWSAKYPIHTSNQIVEPFEIKPRTQIKFPDDDVAILTSSGQVEDVPHRKRVDILFGFDGLDFADAYAGSNNVVFESLKLKLVSYEHLSLISRPAVDIE